MKPARSQSGQLTIEAILIMTILTAIALSFSRFMKSNNLVADVVEGPWRPIQGMIENGVWESGEKAKSHHPSQKSRHSSNQGDVIPAT
jgi:hypothetical protein